MDQRGTGSSTTITKQSLELKFPNLFLLDDTTPNEEHESMFQEGLNDAVDYLTCFRADNIVLDAEEIKSALLIQNSDQAWGAALGQSFGGFCLMTYLSIVDKPPKICLFTGGIAPMLSPSPYDLYLSLFQRVKERTLRYYDEYPEDISMVKKIIRHLSSNKVILPSGGILTPRRFLQLGLGLGGTPLYNFLSLHLLISSAFLNPNDDESKLILSRNFLKDIDTQQVFDEYPLYFLLHESIYANGHVDNGTNWAAYHALQTLIKQNNEWDYTITANDEHKPVLFYGEMIFPWMNEDYAQLAGHGMTNLAHSIATKTTWDTLYNPQQMKTTLSSKKSIACAAVYVDDMYVDFNECRKVLGYDGPLKDCKPFITNVYQHSGIRDDGSVIFDTLWKMAKGLKLIPS